MYSCFNTVDPHVPCYTVRMNAPTIPKPHSPLVRDFFFWSGIIATILYRAIIVLNHVSQTWVLIAWYAGTAGFVLYFAHRYQISERRAKVIAERNLMEKIHASNIGPDDQQAFDYVLGTLRSSKERWNYITIFVTSALALVIGAYLDFFR